MLYAKDFKINLKNLNQLEFGHSRYLQHIESGTFDELEDLHYIKISGAKMLTFLGPDVFGFLPRLEHLYIEDCGLTKVPNLTNLVGHQDYGIKNLILRSNKFTTIQPYTFKDMHDVYRLDLSYNELHYLPNHAFSGATIRKLDLGHNPLNELDEDVFDGIHQLKELSLNNTLITHLPTNGLKYIETLDLYRTYTLRTFPPVFRFKKIETARLTYFSHCCALTYRVEQGADGTKLHKTEQDADVESTKCEPTGTIAPSNTVTFQDTPSPSGVYSYDLSDSEDSYGGIWHHFPAIPPENNNATEPTYPKDESDPWVFGPTLNPDITHPPVTGSKCGTFVPKDKTVINCTPQPNAFNPCSDVMGYIFLRVLIWFVALTALIGNFIVLLVLLAYRHKMTVPKFLMCNLSFADLCMSVYLIMVTSVDLHTLGEYFNFAISWQHGVGCKIAGFISIFSSELSVFSLTVLTIERWYTIIYAIDLNKRIKLRQAAKIIIGAWVFAILFAALPMIGVGSYGVTSMCLPFYLGSEDSPITYAYVLFILLFNAVSFLVICACYVKMYRTVHNPHTMMQQKDSKVAKRMAVLIFTDFACWAPIAIFGIARAFGMPLLTTNESKILIVLFYPINSCANPFLYAIFTKAFRRDLFIMLAKYGMFERQAMKYRGAGSVDPRSYSQAHSYTGSGRDGQNKGHYRGGSSTQITCDARSSVAVFEKDAVHDIDSPDGKKLSHILIPMMPLKDSGNHSIHSLSPTSHISEPSIPITAPKAVPEPEPANASANNNNKQPLMKTLSAVLHVDYTNTDLDTVPEERSGSSDNHEIVLIVPTTHIKTPNDQDNVKDNVKDNDDHSDDVENDLSEDEKGSESERKNSKTDSGVQSNTTTPTEKADQEIVNKTRVLELLNSEANKPTETTL